MQQGMMMTQPPPWAMYGYGAPLDFTSDVSQGFSFIDFGEGDARQPDG